MIRRQCLLSNEFKVPLLLNVCQLHVRYKNVLRDMHALRQHIVYNGNGTIFS